MNQEQLQWGSPDREEEGMHVVQGFDWGYYNTKKEFFYLTLVSLRIDFCSFVFG